MKFLIPMDEYKKVKKTDKLIHRALVASITNLEAALKLVDEAFLGLECPWIAACVRETVVCWYMKARPTEETVYSWFERKYKDKIGSEWEIVKLKSNRKNIPDFWLSNGKCKMPVECKLHEFDDIALKQLKRYIDFYDCKNGVAVGNSLTTKLPCNIMFVKFNYEELEA